MGSRPAVGPDRHHGRRHERDLLGLLCRRSRHHEQLLGLARGDRGQGAVLLALCRPRQPLLAHARSRRQGGQGQPHSSRPGSVPTRHRADPVLFARGQRAFGAHVRNPAEAPAAGAPARRHHRHGRGQPLPQGGLSAGPQRPLRNTGRGPEHRLRALRRSAGRDILCIQEDRTVAGDNTVRYKRLAPQIPPDRHRHNYVKVKVRVHEYPDGTLAVFHGPRCLARYQADREPIEPQNPNFRPPEPRGRRDRQVRELSPRAACRTHDRRRTLGPSRGRHRRLS